jgi:hypothetical protein
LAVLNPEGLRSDEWTLGVRKFDKSLNQRTTGLSEGWHRKIKRRLAGCPSVHQRRIDWLIHMFVTLIDDHISLRECIAYSGAKLQSAC